MASHHAHLSCTLKVEPHCDACKRHAMEVLGSLDGVYDVQFDSQTKTARIMGEVDPNYCMKALARCGMHAELVRVNLTHPRLAAAGAYHHGPYSSNHSSYPRLGNDHYAHYSRSYYGHEPYRRSLPAAEGIWHDYPVRNALPDYSYNDVNYNYYGGPTTSYSYGRPYGRNEYMMHDPYAHEGMSMCCIM